MKRYNQNPAAVEMLKWLRTQVFILLAEDEDNCRIAIYIDADCNNLDCIIGNGKKKVIINIIGDNMQLIVAGKNPISQTTNYAKLMNSLVSNQQLAIAN